MKMKQPQMKINVRLLAIKRPTLNGGFGSRLYENFARYNRIQNFEACGHPQRKKQKFVLRSA
jgi:hypothetical protein